MSPSNVFRRNRGGSATIYATLVLVVMMGIASLAVDFGRYQLAKAELQQAADSAARYGAAGLELGVTAVRSRVAAAALENDVDSSPLVVDTSNDIEFGVWDPQTKLFKVLTGTARAGATALRVTTRRAASRGTGLKLFWTSLVGRDQIDLKARVVVTRGRTIKSSIEADSCIWLAGMPAGSVVTRYDENTQDSVSPAQQAFRVQGLDLTPGNKLSFRQVGGTTGWDDGSEGMFGPDGDTSWDVEQRLANGINSTIAPIQCLVGIFLDSRAPNTYAAAAPLDFSTVASRDFQTLSPGLKQVFFIGDGLNSSGQLQKFVVPAGATRFYMGLMDEKGWWWDNYGTVSTLALDDTLQTVQ